MSFEKVMTRVGETSCEVVEMVTFRLLTYNVLHARLTLPSSLAHSPSDFGSTAKQNTSGSTGDQPAG